MKLSVMLQVNYILPDLEMTKLLLISNYMYEILSIALKNNLQNYKKHLSKELRKITIH